MNNVFCTRVLVSLFSNLLKGLRILETVMLKTILNISNGRMKKIILKGFMIRVCSLFICVVMVINVCG